MILKLHKDQGRLSLQDGTEKLTIQEQGTEGDYFVYEASNDLPVSDLLNLVDQGVLFEHYPFKVKLPAGDLGIYLPDSLRSDKVERITDLPTVFEYSEDEKEVLIGAAVYNQRYMSQEEMQWFRDQGYAIMGKPDITTLYDNNPNWQREELKNI